MSNPIVRHKELILVLGGARAGKSTFAERLADEGDGERVTFVATAEALDEEMRQRIERHRAARPVGWTTIEAPLDLVGALRSAPASTSTVLIDCMTLWVSNIVLREPSVQDAEGLAARWAGELVSAFTGGSARWIIVSNEVGLGLVPPSEVGRAYRDALGRVNQLLAAAADRVYLLVAGVPLVVKGAC